MISENSKNNYNKRNNYFKTSFTQRNKKKTGKKRNHLCVKKEKGTEWNWKT